MSKTFVTITVEAATLPLSADEQAFLGCGPSDIVKVVDLSVPGTLYIDRANVTVLSEPV